MSSKTLMKRTSNKLLFLAPRQLILVYVPGMITSHDIAWIMVSSFFPLNAFVNIMVVILALPLGDQPTDDLPLRMRSPIDNMRSPLYNVLTRQDMWPKDSNIPDLVLQCKGDGYRALKMIICPSHPVFQHQPATLVTTYPTQGTLSMLEFYSLYLDHLHP